MCLWSNIIKKKRKEKGSYLTSENIPERIPAPSRSSLPHRCWLRRALLVHICSQVCCGKAGVFPWWLSVMWPAGGSLSQWSVFRVTSPSPKPPFRMPLELLLCNAAWCCVQLSALLWGWTQDTRYLWWKHSARQKPFGAADPVIRDL